MNALGIARTQHEVASERLALRLQGIPRTSEEGLLLVRDRLLSFDVL